MDAVLTERNVDVRLNTRADELLTDEAGRVTGVRVEAPDGSFYNINAGAVILATAATTPIRNSLPSTTPNTPAI